ncbi:MAG: hypothetical protein LPH21_06330 [Shewanella sp.]|nr:hypothetical protein [Shewanella sp.]
MVARYTQLGEERQILGNYLDDLPVAAFSNHTTTEGIIISNDGLNERILFADFFLSLGEQNEDRNDSAYVGLFLIPIYATAGDTNRTPTLAGNPVLFTNYFAGQLELNNGRSAVTGVIQGVRLPGADFFPVIYNGTGSRFGPVGNFLSMFSYGYEDTP